MQGTAEHLPRGCNEYRRDEDHAFTRSPLRYVYNIPARAPVKHFMGNVMYIGVGTLVLILIIVLIVLLLA